MRRLYLQIYATFVAILLIFVLLIGSVWTFLPDNIWQQRLDGVGALIGEILIPPEQTTTELLAILERVTAVFSAQITVRNAAGEVLASTGEPLPAPSLRRFGGGRAEMQGHRSAMAIELPDGRWFTISWQERGASALFGTIGLLAIAIALGTLPIARRMTGRLERLRTRVEALGAGELSARLDVEGKDEVADLARSFNRAADRIERLVGAQRQVLAGVSHEIRTPLARMRVALELLATENRPELRQRLLQDITELDELIGELLLASRLDTIDQFEHTEDVDLLALLAEEAARTGADVSGEPVSLHGDPRMLRRLIRNLLENARQYAAETTIEAFAAPATDGGAILTVADRGPGIPKEERERIFEPFYRSELTRGQSERSVGLGLSLVRRIAHRHDGDVRCLPRDGGGSIFEVRLRGTG